MSIARPTLFDFANAGMLDPRLAFSRASAATYYDAKGVLQSAPANVLRIDHDPLTGQRLGALIEPARTNLVTNPRFEGGTTGVIGSGGVMPTGMAVASAASLTTEYLGQITDKGRPGGRFKVSGTATGAQYILTVMNVSTPSTVAHMNSMFVKRQAGTNNGIVQFQVRSGVAGGTGTTNIVVASGTLADYTRQSLPVTPGAGATSMNFGVSFTTTNGAAIDITFDILCPQIEQGTYATSIILPAVGAPGATARSADALTAALADLGLSDMGTEGAIVATYRTYVASSDTASGRSVVLLDDGSNNNRVELRRQQASAVPAGLVVASGVTQATATSGAALAADTFETDAFGWALDSVAMTRGGAIPNTDETATMPAGLTTLRFGHQTGGGDNLSGHIARVAIYPRRPANAVLQMLSA